MFVGPQATGKSIFLQLLKLLLDKYAIHQELRRFSIEWRGDSQDFLDLYFGEGMAGIWNPEDSELVVDGEDVDLTEYAQGRRLRREEKLFFIPAQRVLSIRDGVTRPFTDYRAGDPFVLREFSEKLHQLVQSGVWPERNAVSTEESSERCAATTAGGPHLRRVQPRDRPVAASAPNRSQAGR